MIGTPPVERLAAFLLGMLLSRLASARRMSAMGRRLPFGMTYCRMSISHGDPAGASTIKAMIATTTSPTSVQMIRATGDITPHRT
jgi:hypothetical protein